MDDNTSPVGNLFTHTYQDRGQPAPDSVPFRARLASYLDRNHHKELWNLFNFLAQETGYITPGHYLKLRHEFENLSIGQILNVITLIWRFFSPPANLSTFEMEEAKKPSAHWKQFVERALVEENLGYRLDEKCGVHYVIDAEFQHIRSSVLRSLGRVRYDAALRAFNLAHSHLSPSALDLKAAIRSIFESLEIVARLMVGGKNLNRYCAENQLKAAAVRAFGSDATNAASIGASFDAFGLWIDGIHLYRHGQATQTPIEPGLEWTVFIVSSASTYLRLLVDIDQRTLPFA
jgi:hypothetical protein